MARSRSARREALHLSQYPLLLADPPSVRVGSKPLSSVMQAEIEAMLKPTQYRATQHFVQRISQRDGRCRWESMGIFTVHDLWESLRSVYRRPDTQVETDQHGRPAEEWVLEKGAAVLVVNPESKQIATITFA